MFCSVKKDKRKNKYKFYLCDRYRDQATKKVKSSDKYIMTLQKEDILNLSIIDVKNEVEAILRSKSISLENVKLIINKLIDIKKVVIQENNTTSINSDTEIIQAEIVERCNPTYDTTIMFDVQKLYRDNVKTMMGFNSMMVAFSGNAKERFEIEEEELRKLQEQSQDIDNKIDEIYEEYLYINKQNEVLDGLGSEIRLVQDIYISCYNKVPSSEVWFIGGGYIERLYEKTDLVLPGYGAGLFDEWKSIKEYNNLEDSKAYFNREEYFEEIDLYIESNLDIDKSDITGSLVRMILSGNYKIEYSMADWIDIEFGSKTTCLSIEHFIDWINNEPTRDYKVTIDGLMDYKKQLYKFNNVN